MLGFTPPQSRSTLATLWKDAEAQLGSYVRGLFILCFMVSVACTVGFLALRLPDALALGVLMFFLEFIPIPGVGSAIAAVIVTIVTLPDKNPTTTLLALAWTIFVFEGTNDVLFPRVMGKAIGISALGIMASLLIFVTLFGGIGALLAVPIAGVIAIILNQVRQTREILEEPPASFVEVEPTGAQAD